MTFSPPISTLTTLSARSFFRMAWFTTFVSAGMTCMTLPCTSPTLDLRGAKAPSFEKVEDVE